MGKVGFNGVFRKNDIGGVVRHGGFHICSITILNRLFFNLYCATIAGEMFKKRKAVAHSWLRLFVLLTIEA